MARQQGQKSAQGDPGTGGAPLAALVAAVIIGPVGAAMGYRQRVSARRHGRPAPRLSTVALVVGLVQTLVVGGAIGSMLVRGNEITDQKVAIEQSIDSRTPGPRAESTLPPEPTPTETGGRIDDYLPTQVAGMDAGEVHPDTGALDAGAQSASTTTYTDSQGSIDVTTSRWPDTVAAGDALARAQAALGDFQLIKTGPAGSPAVGTYWYYELDGVAKLLWIQGANVSSVTGEPMQVQTFFVRFPLPATAQ